MNSLVESTGGSGQKLKVLDKRLQNHQLQYLGRWDYSVEWVGILPWQERCEKMENDDG